VIERALHALQRFLLGVHLATTPNKSGIGGACW
jgi:hypothetical protein